MFEALSNSFNTTKSFSGGNNSVCFSCFDWTGCSVLRRQDNAEILWDVWGVPHVFADNLMVAVRLPIVARFLLCGVYTCYTASDVLSATHELTKTNWSRYTLPHPRTRSVRCGTAESDLPSQEM